ncbi:MAG: class C sortase [Ruminococcus sp.]|nr:class C sortase [Ruminococcus sp.]MDE6796636.1 class C sortase [Ruminococcus sp.]
MLYPTFSNWWNSKVQSGAVTKYQEMVAQLSSEETERMMQEAHEYNEKLSQLYAPFTNYKEISGYDDILNISGTGIMGFVSIPFIKVELPIYHGTSEEVLNVAAGHLQGSSFPVGGSNTHAVISAHRGLPSAKLFTDLDQLVVGDTFTVNILGEVLTYEVEEILIVKPSEIDKLAIIPDGDYVTLMTCTPYGINSHRMLLRSHRIETAYHYNAKVVADATQVDPLLAVPVIALPFILLLICFWSLSGKKKTERSGEQLFELLYKK